MFETQRMAIAVARMRAQGRFVIDAATVLAWATRDGAAALNLADVGRIEPGCRADLMLLDPHAANLAPLVDGVGIVVHSSSAANVRDVFCDGVQLLAQGRPTQHDAKEIVRATQQVADRLWARARQAQA